MPSHSRMRVLLLTSAIVLAFHWRLAASSEYSWLDFPGVWDQLLPKLQHQAGELHARRWPSTLPGAPRPWYPLHLATLALPLKDGWLRVAVLHGAYLLLQVLAACAAALALRPQGAIASSILGGCVYALASPAAARGDLAAMHLAAMVPLLLLVRPWMGLSAALVLASLEPALLLEIPLLGLAALGSRLVDHFPQPRCAPWTLAAGVALAFTDAVRWTVNRGFADSAISYHGFALIALAAILRFAQTPVPALLLILTVLAFHNGARYRSYKQQDTPKNLLKLAAHADVAAFLRHPREGNPRAFLDPQAIAYDFEHWWSIPLAKDKQSAVYWVSQQPDASFQRLVLAGPDGVNVYARSGN